MRNKTMGLYSSRYGMQLSFTLPHGPQQDPAGGVCLFKHVCVLVYLGGTHKAATSQSFTVVFFHGLFIVWQVFAFKNDKTKLLACSLVSIDIHTFLMYTLSSLLSVPFTYMFSPSFFRLQGAFNRDIWPNSRRVLLIENGTFICLKLFWD